MDYESLDSLPLGSRVLSALGVHFERQEDGRWLLVTSQEPSVQAEILTTLELPRILDIVQWGKLDK